MNDRNAGSEKKNSPATVLFASLIGTTIEFFDFYIYATAAVLVFPTLFFPSSNPTAGMLQSLATFAIAFFARPVGSAVFGHYGDRIGRKATLVAALLTMGISTVVIGLLPTYEAIGTLAPLLLALCRFGQGLGLGGEWGGAVLLATENAPPGKIAWYGCFPQLGAPLGFFLSGGIFLLLSETLTNEQFFSYGWRIPFIASAVLVLVGLYVRLKITETPVFQKVLDKNERVKVPIATIFSEHSSLLVLGTIIATATFVLFYLMTVFALSWGTTGLGYTRKEFLILQLFAVVFFALTIPVSALLADKYGRRITMIYGPLGTMLSELFPTEIRYTGVSLTFNLGGIVGASLAPYAATWLATNYGLHYVGYYLSGATLLTLLALFMVGKQKSITETPLTPSGSKS
jgi:MFS family permease